MATSAGVQERAEKRPTEDHFCSFPRNSLCSAHHTHGCTYSMFSCCCNSPSTGTRHFSTRCCHFSDPSNNCLLGFSSEGRVALNDCLPDQGESLQLTREGDVSLAQRVDHTCGSACTKRRNHRASRSDDPSASDSRGTKGPLSSAMHHCSFPLFTHVVARLVERSSKCGCWDAAGIPKSRRMVYSCLCGFQRCGSGFLFRRSPWDSRCCTFTASTDAFGIPEPRAPHQDVKVNQFGHMSVNFRKRSNARFPRIIRSVLCSHLTPWILVFALVFFVSLVPRHRTLTFHEEIVCKERCFTYTIFTVWCV